MGGDGGVIASNRRYMRGAGTADCTADDSVEAWNSDADRQQQQRHVDLVSRHAGRDQPDPRDAG